MLRTFIIFCTILLSSAGANANFSPYKSTVDKVDKKYIYITDNKAFTVGSSGVVLHPFDETHQTIVAAIEVVEKKDGQAKLLYKNFEGLKQSALPAYDIKPAKGDHVILNYLYERAMAITPNAKMLKQINHKYVMFDWIHPDIFAAALAIDYHPIPDKEDFQAECRENSFALLFFAIDDKGYFVDCNSFKVLHKTDLAQTGEKSETVVPFYSRMKKIKGRMFGLMGGEGITNYSRYYKKLLGIK